VEYGHESATPWRHSGSLRQSPCSCQRRRRKDIGGVDLVFDVIGGEVQQRSAAIIRPGGTLVSVVGPVEARPVDGLAVDFVVESVPSQLVEIVDRVRDGRLRTHIGTVATLDDAIPALNPTGRRKKGKTVIPVRP
jgi:NADPH:quinone reductase-like Zn-dependent oxidoreductase